MHTINGMLNKRVCALALGFIVLAYCVGPVWAQEGESEGGYQRSGIIKGILESPYMLSGGDGEGEAEGGYQLPEIGKDEVADPPVLNGGDGEGEGEGEGGYQRSGNAAFSIAGSIAQPDQPALLGNYPNPFNPETTLRFEVQAAQHVRLSVFNALGQQVRMLVDGWVEAGAHEARFDGYGLPSGTYFSRLVTEAGVVTRTMVLAK